MEDHAVQTIHAFDSCYTTGQIQMLKIIFAHLPREHQGSFAVYIKLMELLHAFSLINNPPYSTFLTCGKKLSADFFGGNNEDSVAFLQELLQFSGPVEAQKIKNMIQMLENMRKMQEMMEMIQMMQEMFPEGAGDMSGGFSGNPMDFISGLMGGPDGSGMNMGDLFGMFNH